jgi:phosphoribosylformylglycinamidine synthase subunit PurQ / glutaminase
MEATDRPLALIIRTAGTNCDVELAHAFQLAGAEPVTHHLNELIEHPDLIEQADLIGFPGGFSYGDDIAAGRILANRMRHRLAAVLQDAVNRGVPMIGICNGFQVLIKMGLLPDPPTDEQPQAGQHNKQQATLADNTSGRFIDRWIGVETPADSVCIWTKGLSRYDLPIAHGEGRFVPGSNELLQQWQSKGQVALRYASMTTGVDVEQANVDVISNPNGSVDDIAAVCDSKGLILGLMPHPERFIHKTNHPMWTRLSANTQNDDASDSPAGLKMFENAVEHIKQVKAAKLQASVEVR